jgi:cytochrome oxidase Cu insertion factor (SCO1/SenC/PrrC family)
MEAGAPLSAERRRIRPIHLTLVVICGVAGGLAIALLVHSLAGGHASAPSIARTNSPLHGQATWAERTRPAPAIAGLHDQTGRTFSLASLRGHTIALAFFDSHCNQACPLEGRALAIAESSVPAAQRPVLVVVSVNPRDTAASSRAAARKWHLAQVSAWHWLRGSKAELARVWKAYHIFVAPPRNGDITHTEALYLIDQHGYERSGYLYPFLPRYVADDLRYLDRSGGSKAS